MSKSGLILVDTQNRSKLSEGRNWGVGYSFVLKNKNTYTTQFPLTCCKDFLHEIVHSQHTKAEWSKYGLNTQYVDGLFDFKKNLAYMVIGILGYNKSKKEYAKQNDDIKTLSNNLTNLEKFLNWFEDKFKIENKTNLFRFKTDNRYLCVTPIWWTEHSYKISLYTWLIRVGFYWNGADDILEYLKDIKYSDEDRMFYKTIAPKLERMLSGDIPNPKMSKSDSCPHERGIIGYNFPTLEESKAQTERVEKGLAFLNTAVFATT